MTTRFETKFANFSLLDVTFTSDIVYGLVSGVAKSLSKEFRVKTRGGDRCVHFSILTCVAEQVTMTVEPEHAEISSPSDTGMDVSVKALEPAAMEVVQIHESLWINNLYLGRARACAYTRP